MTGWVYVASRRFTVAVRVVNGVIYDGPPIIKRRWIGRTLHGLLQAWGARAEAIL